MHIKTVVAALMGLSAVVEATELHHRSLYSSTVRRPQNNRGDRNGGQQGGKRNGGNNGQNGGNNGDKDDAGGALSPNLIQTASAEDGNNPGADGQAASETDNNNFINFCQGQTVTNGQQILTGSCNGIPMGRIPSINNIVSSVFVNPKDGDNLPANQDFKIQVHMLNFKGGTFTNATSTYYSAPQDLDGQGRVIGHTHVTVQDTGRTLNPQRPLDPTQFAFFKGINDDGNGQGLLAADVVGGLPAGNYRACSMSSAANHQPVLMPVARRGAQDDCVRFTVGGNGGNNGGGQSRGGQLGGGRQGGQGTGDNGPKAGVPSRNGTEADTGNQTRGGGRGSSGRSRNRGGIRK